MKKPLEITPSVLRWLLTQLDPVKDAASTALIKTWLEGAGRPDYGDLAFISKVSGIPIGLFGLKNPPSTLLPFKLPDGIPARSGLTLSQLSDKMLLLQQWLANYYLREAAGRHKFTAALPGGDEVSIAAHICQYFALTASMFERCANLRDAFLLLRRKVSAARICVMLSGLGPQYRLNPLQFTVFTLPDACAPLLCLNARQSYLGQILSLLQGLSALCAGQSLLCTSQSALLHDTLCAQRIMRSLNLTALPDHAMDSGLSPAEQAALSIDHQAYELLRRDCLDGFLPRETLLKRLNIPAELIDQFPSACQSLAARCRALR